MNKSMKYLTKLIQAIPAAAKALRGRDIDAGAYVTALAAIAATTHICVRFLELRAGIV